MNVLLRSHFIRTVSQNFKIFVFSMLKKDLATTVNSMSRFDTGKKLMIKLRETRVHSSLI